MPHSVHHLSRVSHQGTESGTPLLSAKVAANAGKESLKPRFFVEAHLADLSVLNMLNPIGVNLLQILR
jgi:hypothetical protein